MYKLRDASAHSASHDLIMNTNFEGEDTLFGNQPVYIADISFEIPNISDTRN